MNPRDRVPVWCKMPGVGRGIRRVGPTLRLPRGQRVWIVAGLSGIPVWPTTSGGAVSISAAQLGYLLEGIDWRNPVRTWRPSRAG